MSMDIVPYRLSHCNHDLKFFFTMIFPEISHYNEGMDECRFNPYK